MNWIPMLSMTEGMVTPNTGFMEFNLQMPMGYREWRGMFTELGVESTLFNGYALQYKDGGKKISDTAVQLHFFEHGLYIAPPFVTEEYYFHIPIRELKIGKVYFDLPKEQNLLSLEGYKPKREQLQAIDIWSCFSEDMEEQIIYSFFYEVHIQTDSRIYHFERFRLQQ
ncbi:hypothetical protein FY534_10785 [Alicyclobacillus sp. TC]|uniref:hypothetical protein n=1 Tax=Alicyclobacillus sp. TC TaxID=2606450 RepID=UPI001934ACFB|nr:hypothetical protein [Alicyclobacillus sp. TC]QRF24070.1 hypothetical protein FY534_10785 [Alicyclobacillus sp. TC]